MVKDKLLERDDDVDEIHFAEYVSRLAYESMQSETDRHASLLASANRLLTSESIVIAALSFVFGVFGFENDDQNMRIVPALVAVIVLVLISFIACLLSQWRFRYIAPESPKKLMQYALDSRGRLLSEESIAIDYCKSMEEIFNSLVKRNNRMCLFLKIAISCLIAAVAIFSLFLVAWSFGLV